MKGYWVASCQRLTLSLEHSTAYRVWTGTEGWIERFGEDFLICAADLEEGKSWIPFLQSWCAAADLPIERVFLKRRVKQPQVQDVPAQVWGQGFRGDGRMAGKGRSGRSVSHPEPVVSLQRVVSERGLLFEVDFSVGYSVGLFCDQRLNRAYLETLRPQRVLNGFAYTCAFSVAAVRAGAEVLSVDVAKKALKWGQRNLALNGLPQQRWLADDVLQVFPRLLRRGERFDVIVLDPPTFGRVGRRVFRIEEDFQELIACALKLLMPEGHLLLATHAEGFPVQMLKKQVAQLHPALRFQGLGLPPEYPATQQASTFWVSFR